MVCVYTNQGVAEDESVIGFEDAYGNKFVVSAKYSLLKNHNNILEIHDFTNVRKVSSKKYATIESNSSIKLFKILL